MKKKTFIIILAIIGVAMLLFIMIKNKKAPVAFSSDGLLLQYSIDQKIKRAELIVIGEVKTTLPSRWNGPNGNDPKNASPEDVVRARGLFTDSLISINQILKGDSIASVVRVRAFTGQTENVLWANKSEPSYIVGNTYLLFLLKDHGPTSKVNPGDYIAVGAFQGVYEIIDGKAILADDEWVLEELISYIEKSLSGEVSSPTLTPIPTEILIETPLSFTETPVATDLPAQTLLPAETASPTP